MQTPLGLCLMVQQPSEEISLRKSSKRSLNSVCIPRVLAHMWYPQQKVLLICLKGNVIQLLQYKFAADVESSDSVKGCGQCALTAPERPPSFAHSSRLDTRGMSFSLSRVFELHAKSLGQTPTPIQSLCSKPACTTDLLGCLRNN